MGSWRATYSKSWVLTWEGSARVSKQVADAIQPESRRFSSRGLEGSTPKPGNKILLRWSSVVNYATVYSWLLLRIRPITTAWALVAADPVQKPDKKPAGDDDKACHGKMGLSHSTTDYSSQHALHVSCLSSSALLKSACRHSGALQGTNFGGSLSTVPTTTATRPRAADRPMQRLQRPGFRQKRLLSRNKGATPP